MKMMANLQTEDSLVLLSRLEELQDVKGLHLNLQLNTLDPNDEQLIKRLVSSAKVDRQAKEQAARLKRGLLIGSVASLSSILIGLFAFL